MTCEFESRPEYKERRFSSAFLYDTTYRFDNTKQATQHHQLGLTRQDELRSFIDQLPPETKAIAIEHRHLEHNVKTLKMLVEVATRIKIYAEDAGIPVIEVASAAWQRKLYPAKRKPGMTNAQWKRTKYLFFERIFRNLCVPHLRQA